MRVRFSDDASIDLTEIVDFGAETWGETAAKVYLDRIGKAVDRLSDHPELGSTVEEAPTFRRWSVGSHLIFYQLDQGELLVVRVLHASRDFERYLP